MNTKLKKKYYIAIYLLIAAVAISLFLVGYFKLPSGKNDALYGTLLNLSTELLGVVLIFFVVNYFFSSDEWELNEKVDTLLKGLDKNKSVSSVDFFKPIPNIEPLLKNSKNINLCGVALGFTIDKNLNFLRDCVRNGSNIRVLIIDELDHALEVSTSRSEDNNRNYFENKRDQTLLNLDYLFSNSSENPNHKYKGEIKVGFLPYPPSFGLLIFEKSKKESTCIVEIYPHHVGWGNPPSFTLDKENDKEWYQYFISQFEAMWERSKKHIPKLEANR